MRNIAYSSILDITEIYNSTNFIDNRSSLESNYLDYLQTKFDKQTKYLVRVQSLYILKIDFNQEFEDSILNKLYQSVDIKMNELEKNLSAINEAKIYLANSDIEAYAKNQIKVAQGQALNTLITTDADAYKSVDTKFGFSFDNSLINFILAIEQSSFGARQIVGYKTAEISVK